MTVGGSIARKPARLVAAREPLRILGPPARFVGRGGEKLAAAIREFGLMPTGERVVDAGASTGGFTDCLLQAGAASVVAIDVGRNQLHERLRADPRVQSLERTDIRRVAPESIGGSVPLVVADLSFISLRTVLPSLFALLSPGGQLVLLVKPQFEAGRAEVAKGKGVISEPTVWRRTLGEVCDAIERSGAAIMGAMVSPLRGAEGNVEFLLLAGTPNRRLDRQPVAPADLDRLVEAVAP